LLDHEYAWVTFTATAAERRLLHNVDARCIDLGYTHDLHVMAGYLPLARKM
jgi:hypothetical protein